LRGWRELQTHVGTSDPLPNFEIALAILFAYFGVSSFFRAASGQR